MITVKSNTDIKIGGQIILQDKTTILDLMALKRPYPMDGESFTVKERMNFREKNDLFQFIIYRLVNENQTVFLAYKKVDDAIDIRVYTENGWLTPATRAEQIAAGHQFLFAPPANENDFKPCDLELTEAFNLTIKEKDIQYVKKYSSVYGEYTETPRKSGYDYPFFAAVTEYSTTEEVNNYEVLVLEVGGLDRHGEVIADGPCLTFLEGRNVSELEVNII